MKKRLIGAAVALVMVFNLVLVPDGAAVFNSKAAETIYNGGDGWWYKLDSDSTAIIVAYNGSETNVTVPSTIGGKKVTVTSYAYDSGLGISGFGNKVVSVTIPSSVTWIGDSTFFGCSSLKTVTIPSSVTGIGREVFVGCVKLTEITVNSSSKHYTSENGVLYNKAKTKLLNYPAGKTAKNYTIPSSVTSIEEVAFYGSKNLTSMTIPSGVTSIGEWAFWNCTGLTSVTIPNSVKYIGDYAFVDCTGLKSVIIPNSVKLIRNSVFNGCSSLTSVTIPNSVTSIGEWAFYDCVSLKSVTIPNSVKDIGRNAFYYCISLTSVTIGNGVESIGQGVFLDCVSLKSVTIPNSVKDIGLSAFDGCVSLTSVTIPNSVTSIGGQAFWNCTSLKSVIIPSSVESVGYGAFRDCSSLKSVVFKSSKPPTFGDWSVFSGCGNPITIYVPKGAVSAYKNVEPLVGSLKGYKIAEYDEYKITYNLNSGKNPSGTSQTYIHGVSSALPTPTRTGYKFEGWYTNANFTESKLTSTGTTRTGDLTLYAKWTAETYKITYKLGSSKAQNNSSNPSAYTYGKSTSLKKPTRSGYVFSGWYTKESLSSSSKTTSISKTSTGNVTLYAKWVKLPSKPTSVKVTANSKSKITVTWKKVSDAKGYEVYRATSKDGKYKKVKTVSKGATVKYADKSLKANKKYYYKVRAYKLVDGKKVYSDYSAVKSAKTKK